MGFFSQIKLHSALRSALTNPARISKAKLEIDQVCAKHGAAEALATYLIAMKPFTERPGAQFIMFKWIAMNGISAIQSFGMVERTKSEAFSDFCEVLDALISQNKAPQTIYTGAFCKILEEEFSGEPMSAETEQAYKTTIADLEAYAGAYLGKIGL